MRAIVLTVLLALAGCTANNASPLQPEWMTECQATCANGYQTRWEQLLEAPRGDALARELEDQCVLDLVTAGCTWPICECRAQVKK